MKIRILPVFLALMAIAAVVPAAQAATKHMSISPTALLPTNSSVALLEFSKWDSYFYFTAAASTYNDAFMYAPINLPHNSTITSLTVWYTRNTDDGDNIMSVTLHRHDLYTGKVVVVAGSSYLSTPASGARRVKSTRTIADPIVNNIRYSYSLLVGFSRPMNKLKFHGARIGYME
jgi:hypothetical protein